MNTEVVDVFEHRDRKCVIVSFKMSGSGTELARGLTARNYHNGYFRIAKSKEEVSTEIREDGLTEGHDHTYDKYQDSIEEVELTFSGQLDELEKAPDGYYLGFDTAHAWNQRQPETQTQESVKSRLKTAVEQYEENFGDNQ